MQQTSMLQIDSVFSLISGYEKQQSSLLRIDIGEYERRNSAPK